MRLAVSEMAKGSKEPAGKKPEFTTFRVFAADGEDLSELADKRNTSVAKLYRELFAETVRQLLLKEARQRLQELESRKPH